jgi:hypothetical protein
MQKEAFLQIVSQAGYIKDARKQQLVESADWMKPEERQYLAKQIVETGEKIEAMKAKEAEEWDKYYEVLQEFKQHEMPKILKEEEAKEEKGEQKAAEDVLSDLDNTE